MYTTESLWWWAGACLSGAVVLREPQPPYTAVISSPVDQGIPSSPNQKQLPGAPHGRSAISGFHLTFSWVTCSSPKITFCLQQVLQIPAGSVIILAWECYNYKLSDFFHTSDGVDNIWWGSSFHLVTNTEISVFPFISVWWRNCVGLWGERKSH